MSIPRILHQTWKTREVPAEFLRFRESWRRRHPHWEIRLYDDDACRDLVLRDFPHLASLYDGLPTNIQRADLFRYLAVYRFGGVYADLDMECYRPIEPLLGGRSCVFGTEAEFGESLRRRLNYRRPYQVANCIFAAKPRHPFFQLLLERIQGPPLDGIDIVDAVEDTTGPRFLTRVFQEVREQFPGMTLLPQIHWMPPNRPSYPNCFPFNVHIYCRHHFVGSWKTGRNEEHVGLGQRFRERWYHPWPWLRSDFEPATIWRRLWRTNRRAEPSDVP
jgi:mannosyltransferase OCH1-like enzyme